MCCAEQSWPRVRLRDVPKNGFPKYGLYCCKYTGSYVFGKTRIGASNSDSARESVGARRSGAALRALLLESEERKKESVNVSANESPR